MLVSSENQRTTVCIPWMRPGEDEHPGFTVDLLRSGWDHSLHSSLLPPEGAAAPAQ